MRGNPRRRSGDPTAAASVRGIEAGHEEITPDPLAQGVETMHRQDPAGVDVIFAAMG